MNMATVLGLSLDFWSILTSVLGSVTLTQPPFEIPLPHGCRIVVLFTAKSLIH